MRIFAVRTPVFNLKTTLIAILQSLLLGISSQAFALSTVELTLDDGSAAEFQQVPGTFTVTRTDDGNIATGLDVWMTIGGNATLDGDYSRPGVDHRGADNFSVHIQPGQLSRTITLTPQLDNTIEGTEDISIQLQDIGVAYTASELTIIELLIADFVELIFEDGFEDP